MSDVEKVIRQMKQYCDYENPNDCKVSTNTLCAWINTLTQRNVVAMDEIPPHVYTPKCEVLLSDQVAQEGTTQVNESEACEVNDISSRVCSRGTKSCILEHVNENGEQHA